MITSTINAIKQLRISTALLITLVCWVAITATTITAPLHAAPSDTNTSKPVTVTDPGTDLWRAVRQRDTEINGTTRMQNPDAGVLINASGQEWREFRMEKLIPYSMLLLGGILLVLFLFRLIRGKMKLHAGRSGIKVPRFTPFQRLVHWSVAILFVVLGITGLILTFGRDGLIPIIGNEVFSWVAIIAKRIHDFAGPVFAIMLIVMLFTFMKGNFAKLVDFKWMMKAGGLLGGGHVSAGRYNAGEKAWYWFAMIAGVVVVGSGLILDFPIFGQERSFLELSHMTHAIAAVIMLAASFGHIYMGTVGVEGAFEAMQTGYCDSNWAKEHHDIWYEAMLREGKIDKTFEEMTDQEKLDAQARHSRLST